MSDEGKMPMQLLLSFFYIFFFRLFKSAAVRWRTREYTNNVNGFFILISSTSSTAEDNFDWIMCNCFLNCEFFVHILHRYKSTQLEILLRFFNLKRLKSIKNLQFEFSLNFSELIIFATYVVIYDERATFSKAK